MATEIQEQVQIDPKAHIEARNKAQAEGLERPLLEETPAKAEEKAKPVLDEEEEHEKPTGVSRSARREMNKLREEKAAATAKADLLQDMFDRGLIVTQKNGVTKVSESDDPEPKREDFATETEHQRALGRWDARQETRVQLSAKDEDQAWNNLVAEMGRKAREDSKNFDDWDEVQRASEEAFQNGDAPGIVPDSQLERLIKASEYRASVVYHLAKNPDVTKDLLSLSGAVLVRNFGRLESRVETLYSTKQDKGAGPSSIKKVATTHPAEVDEAGRNASERDVRKPRPTEEVSARGGSPPPQEVTAANNPKLWMEQRNRATGGR